MNQLQFKNSDEYIPGETIISHQQIQDVLHDLSLDLSQEYKGKQLVIVGVLKGAYWLVTDLVAYFHEAGLTDIELEFVTLKTYTHGTTATSEPKLVGEPKIELKDRNVLLVDDIADTGKSLEFLTKHIKSLKVATLKSLVLLDKPSRRKVEFAPDYIGFTIPDIWVQGYGMDTDEKGRGERNIIKGPF